MKPFLIIQNDAQEGAGHLLTLIHQRQLMCRTISGWDVDYKNLQQEDYCALIILGGAQGVYELDKYPYLKDEIDLANSFIMADKPVIGLCLGGQIIATALGGEVLKNEQKEIGWIEIQLSEDATHDDLMMMHPDKAQAFHFHGDYFTLPPGCVSLARSELTECQLFRYKKNVYGFQFHAEIDQPLLEIMCRLNAEYMKSSGHDAESVIKESEDHLINYQLRCSSILNNWLDMAR